MRMTGDDGSRDRDADSNVIGDMTLRMSFEDSMTVESALAAAHNTVVLGLKL